MDIIERKEEPTKALAKFVKKNNVRLIYVTGPMGSGKKTFGKKLSNRLKKLNYPCLTDDLDIKGYHIRQASDAPDINNIFKKLLITCCKLDYLKDSNLEEVLKDEDLKNMNIVLSIYHLEILLEEPVNSLELIKTCTHMVLDALPKCYIIFTSGIQCNYLNERQKSIYLRRLMKNESVKFLKNYVKNHEELAKYGERMATMCDFLPFTLSLAGVIWSTIDSQFYEDVEEFIDYLEDPAISLKILSTKDFLLEDRIHLKIKRSLETLNSDYISDLMAISYIPGTFNDAAISAILEKRSEDVEILKMKNILVTEKNDRYDVLKSVRDYINEVIVQDYPSENKLVLHMRYSRFFGNILDEYQSRLNSRDCSKALLPIDQEYTNLQKFLTEAVHANNSYKPYIEAAVNAESLIVNFLQKESLEFYENLLKASEQIGSFKEQGQIYSALSEIYSTSFCDYKQGRDYGARALDRLQRSNESVQLDMGTVLNRLGFASFKEGETKKALKYLTKADEIFDMEGRKQFSSLQIMMKHSAVLANRGITSILIGDYDNARKYHVKVLRMRKPILSKGHISVAVQFNSLGLVEREKNNYEEAMINFKESLKIKRTIFPKGNAQVLIGFYNLLDIYVKLNMLDEVEKLFQPAKKCIENLGRGGNQPLIGSIYTAYASSLIKQKEYSKACEMFQEAYQIRENYGPDKPFLFHAITGYVNGLRLLGNYERAIEVGSKGENVVEKLLAQRPEHTLIPTLYMEIFLVYKCMENMRNSKKYLKIFIKHVDRLMHTEIRHEKRTTEHVSLLSLIDIIKELNEDLKTMFYEMTDFIECSKCNFNLKEHILSLNI